MPGPAASAANVKSTADDRPRGKAIWEDAPTELTRTDVFMQVYGETGSGRTTFALGAPGPIAFLHSSEKIEGIIQPFARKKTIKTYDFGAGIDLRWSREKVSKAAWDSWKGFKEAIMGAREWGARTIIVDTDTDAWELCRLAEFGKIAQVKPIHYGPVNAEWLLMMRELRNQREVNVVLISKIKEVYANDKPTGRMIPDSQKGTRNVADVRVRTWRKGKAMDGEFCATVEKAWWNDAAMVGEVVEGADVEFGMVMAMVTEGEWGE